MKHPVHHLLIVLCLSATVSLGANDCLVHFFNASPESENRSQLIAETYRKLLESLGGDKLPPDVIGEMLSAKSPLVIPERASEQVGLRKRLHEFHEMLKTGGWDGEATHELLTRALTEYSGAIARQTNKLARALRADYKDYEIPVELKTSPPMHSSDGRWVLAFSGAALPGHPGQKSFLLFDTETKTKRVLPRPLEFGETAFFSVDGKSLLFKTGNDGLTEVPFENGDIQWANAQNRVWPGLSTVPITQLLPTNLPHLYLVGLAGQMAIFKDTKQGSTQAWALPGSKPGEGYSAIAWVPTQNRFVAVKADGGQSRIQVFEYLPRGMPTFESAHRILPVGGSILRFSHDGVTLIATGEFGGSKLWVGPTLGTSELEVVTSAAGTEAFPGKIVRVIPYPDRNYALVVYRSTGGKDQVEIVDLALKKGIKAMPLPTPMSLASAPLITPDGSRLHYQNATGVQVFNLEAHFPSP